MVGRPVLQCREHDSHRLRTAGHVGRLEPGRTPSFAGGRQERMGLGAPLLRARRDDAGPRFRRRMQRHLVIAGLPPRRRRIRQGGGLALRFRRTGHRVAEGNGPP